MKELFDFIAENFWLISGGALSACFVAWLGYRSNVKAQRNIAYSAASSAFLASVSHELQSIYPIPANWPEDIREFLSSRYGALQSAVENFRPFVKDKSGFSRAWLCFYCAYPDKMNEQCYHHYMDSYESFTGTQEMAVKKSRATFRANVEKLLSYAEEI